LDRRDRATGGDTTDTGGEDESGGRWREQFIGRDAAPPAVSAILQRSCQDCQSKLTNLGSRD
jgi:hypothetical protein